MGESFRGPQAWVCRGTKVWSLPLPEAPCTEGERWDQRLHNGQGEHVLRRGPGLRRPRKLPRWNGAYWFIPSGVFSGPGRPPEGPTHQNTQPPGTESPFYIGFSGASIGEQQNSDIVPEKVPSAAKKEKAAQGGPGWASRLGRPGWAKRGPAGATQIFFLAAFLTST